MRHALVFPYGRSVIYSALRALNLTGDVVQPAYNCVVVAHATMVAGCRPVFVDAQARSPNQNVEHMLERVGLHTTAVIPTSIFGVTFDAGSLVEAIRRKSPQALILIDCCQCFDACWQGQPLATQGDAAILAFGIGKPMTTLFGGALLTHRDDLAGAVRRYRDSVFRPRSWPGTMRRWAYFLASWTSLSPPMGATILENADTPLHRSLLRLRARDAVRLPPDNETRMTRMEAAIGRVRLDACRRSSVAAERSPRRMTASWPGWKGCSFSTGPTVHSARDSSPGQPRGARPTARGSATGRRSGRHESQLCGAGLECYRQHGYEASAFPNAVAWSQSVINLPNHPTMTDAQVERVVRVVRAACA